MNERTNNSYKRHTEREIAELADRQHGVVATWQLALDRNAIAYRVRVGRFFRRFRGVYAIGRPSLTPKGHWMAATLTYGPEAVVSHRTAAALWGVANSGWKIDVTTPRRKRGRSGIRHHTAPLHPDERTIRDNIPVTSVVRTIFDLAAQLPREPLAKIFEAADRLELLDLRAIERAIERKLPGRRKISAILADYRGPADTRSELERKFRALIHASGLPEPQWNVVVAGVLCDAYWPRWRLVVELDHPRYHSSPRQFENDRRRDATLLKADVRVLRITAKRLNGEPAAVLADIRALAAVRMGPHGPRDAA